MTYIPYLSTIIIFVFAFAVYNRYRQRGGVHLLIWAIGLLFFAVGTLSEVILSLTYNILILKVWYLTGAMLTAAWLGTGTVHLLIRKGNAAKTITWILAAISALVFILVMLAPVVSSNYDIARPATEQYQDIFARSGLMITFTILLNIYGTITLVGGAIYSAFLFWRKRVFANRMFGNILIATGALAPAMAGSLLKAGYADLLYLSEFIGGILMFIGFIQSTSGKSETAE